MKITDGISEKIEASIELAFSVQDFRLLERIQDLLKNTINLAIKHRNRERFSIYIGVYALIYIQGKRVAWKTNLLEREYQHFEEGYLQSPFALYYWGVLECLRSSNSKFDLQVAKQMMIDLARNQSYLCYQFLCENDPNALGASMESWDLLNTTLQQQSSAIVKRKTDTVDKLRSVAVQEFEDIHYHVKAGLLFWVYHLFGKDQISPSKVKQLLPILRSPERSFQLFEHDLTFFSQRKWHGHYMEWQFWKAETESGEISSSTEFITTGAETWLADGLLIDTILTNRYYFADLTGNEHPESLLPLYEKWGKMVRSIREDEILMEQLSSLTELEIQNTSYNLLRSINQRYRDLDFRKYERDASYQPNPIAIEKFNTVLSNAWISQSPLFSLSKILEFAVPTNNLDVKLRDGSITTIGFRNQFQTEELPEATQALISSLRSEIDRVERSLLRTLFTELSIAIDDLHKDSLDHTLQHSISRLRSKGYEPNILMVDFRAYKAAEEIASSENFVYRQDLALPEGRHLGYYSGIPLVSVASGWLSTGFLLADTRKAFTLEYETLMNDSPLFVDLHFPSYEEAVQNVMDRKKERNESIDVESHEFKESVIYEQNAGALRLMTKSRLNIVERSAMRWIRIESGLRGSDFSFGDHERHDF